MTILNTEHWIEFLKIDIKKFQIESQFLRKEMHKATSSISKELISLARVRDLRKKTRCYNLVYNLLRGHEYTRCEKRHHDRADWKAVWEMIEGVGVQHFDLSDNWLRVNGYNHLASIVGEK